MHAKSVLSFISTADKHRVQLKGVLPDYIHATFVNVFQVVYINNELDLDL